MQVEDQVRTTGQTHSSHSSCSANTSWLTTLTPSLAVKWTTLPCLEIPNTLYYTPSFLVCSLLNANSRFVVLVHDQFSYEIEWAAKIINLLIMYYCFIQVCLSGRENEWRHVNRTFIVSHLLFQSLWTWLWFLDIIFKSEHCDWSV